MTDRVTMMLDAVYERMAETSRANLMADGFMGDALDRAMADIVRRNRTAREAFETQLRRGA